MPRVPHVRWAAATVRAPSLGECGDTRCLGVTNHDVALQPSRHAPGGNPPRQHHQQANEQANHCGREDRQRHGHGTTGEPEEVQGDGVLVLCPEEGEDCQELGHPKDLSALTARVRRGQGDLRQDARHATLTVAKISACLAPFRGRSVRG